MDGTSNSSSNDLPTKMKAIVFTKPLTSPKGMTVIEWPWPEPKDDELLVRVKYFGLNYADTLARKGAYDDAPAYPYIPGYECSGVVVKIGSKVTKFKEGDKVLAFTMFGSYAEYAVAKEVGTCVIPAGMSFSDAASIPVVFATAYYAIHNTGPVYKGDKILIHAAAGGVGLAAVQLAKIAGLVVYGTASKPDKIKLLKEKYSVDHVINYREANFAKEIERIEGGNKACLDIVLDSVGGSYFKKEIPLIRPGGRLVGYGASSVSDRSVSQAFSLISNVVSMVTLSSIDLLLGCKAFVGVNLKRLSEARPEIVADILTNVMDLFVKNRVTTSVSQIYDWDQIDKAHADIESRGTTGKLVLRVVAGNSEDDPTSN